MSSAAAGGEGQVVPSGRSVLDIKCAERVIEALLSRIA